MTDTSWDPISDQLRDLLYAATADDVIKTLAWELTPLGVPVGDADGYFAGQDGSATVWDALRKAGWHTAWSGGENAYVMFAPDHTLITYIDGRIYRGDQRARFGG